MGAFAEEVSISSPQGDALATSRGIVSLDTRVQDQGLWYYRFYVSVDWTNLVWQQVAAGYRLGIRGKTYTVQVVEQDSDPSWRRILIA